MNWNALINSLVFSLLGLALFCVGFVLIDRLTPYNLWQEIVEKKNMALAVLLGMVSIGLCLIIAAAVHG